MHIYLIISLGWVLRSKISENALSKGFCRVTERVFRKFVLISTLCSRSYYGPFTVSVLAMSQSCPEVLQKEPPCPTSVTAMATREQLDPGSKNEGPCDPAAPPYMDSSMATMEGFEID